jgi:glutathione S-transferase
MASQEPQLTLYTAGTPNGWKIPPLLEELGLPYKVVALDIMKNETKEPWFLKINPNGRIPALTDHAEGEFQVFESGSILIYLADKFDKEGTFLPKQEDFKNRTDVISWLMFQMGGVGPMQGQANHFLKFAPEEGQTEYAQQRYLNETKRLYSVLEERLKDNEWLAAGRYTIADMATVTWVIASKIIDLDLNEFPAVKKWTDKIVARPATRKGLDVPSKNRFLD